MAKVFWHKCSVQDCEERCCSTQQYGGWRGIKCEKHRRQDEIERVIDRAYEGRSYAKGES